MANSAGMCASFKAEILQGVHALGPTSGSLTPARASAGVSDTIKGALYLASGALSPTTTTAYGTTSEVSGTGYTAGGMGVTFGTAPAASGSAAIVTPTADLVWTGLTLSTAFDTLLLYNASQGNRAISLHNFGSQTITAGSLTLSMPVNAVGTALLEID